MKIAIIIPSSDMVHADFAMHLTQLVAITHAAKHQIAIVNPRGSLVQKNRWAGTKDSLELGIDKILFIDSDQTFPPDALIRLINHNKKIVGATCRQRMEGGEYTARGFNGDRIDFSQRKGLHEVGSNGFPFMLIDAEVFQKIHEPWFNVSFNDGYWISEDETFCRAARVKGYKVWVDADLTHEIGHIGQKVY